MGPLTDEEKQAAEEQKSGWQVLCPAYRYIEPETERLLGLLERVGVDVARAVGASDIVRVRSNLATQAMYAKKKRLLWIDADQVMAFEDAVRLLLAKEEFVTAVTPGRSAPFRLLMDVADPKATLELGETGGLVRIKHCGMGSVAHSVNILERLSAFLPTVSEGWVPFFLPFVQDGVYLSEDYAFCARASKVVEALWADTRIRVGHIGSYIYQWEDVYVDRKFYQSLTLQPPVAPLEAAEPGPVEPGPLEAAPVEPAPLEPATVAAPAEPAAAAPPAPPPTGKTGVVHP